MLCHQLEMLHLHFVVTIQGDVDSKGVLHSETASCEMGISCSYASLACNWTVSSCSWYVSPIKPLNSNLTKSFNKLPSSSTPLVAESIPKALWDSAYWISPIIWWSVLEQLMAQNTMVLQFGPNLQDFGWPDLHICWRLHLGRYVWTIPQSQPHANLSIWLKFCWTKLHQHSIQIMIAQVS